VKWRKKEVTDGQQYQQHVVSSLLNKQAEDRRSWK